MSNNAKFYLAISHDLSQMEGVPFIKSFAVSSL